MTLLALLSTLLALDVNVTGAGDLTGGDGVTEIVGLYAGAGAGAGIGTGVCADLVGSSSA